MQNHKWRILKLRSSIWWIAWFYNGAKQFAAITYLLDNAIDLAVVSKNREGS
jgi:hypothetical protein